MSGEVKQNDDMKIQLMVQEEEDQLQAKQISQNMNDNIAKPQENKAGMSMAKRQQSFRQSFAVKDGKGLVKTGYESMDVDQALNAVIYGTEITKYSQNGKKCHLCFFYILESDTNILQWLSPLKKFSESRIKLSDIKSVYIMPKVNDISNYIASLSLCFMLEGGRELVLQFEETKQRNLWQKAINHLKEYRKDLELNKQQIIIILFLQQRIKMSLLTIVFLYLQFYERFNINYFTLLCISLIIKIIFKIKRNFIKNMMNFYPL